MEGGLECVGEQRPNLLRGRALLGENPPGQLVGFLVAGALGNAAQQLVGRDLEMLERVREPRQLRRRVGLRAEERAPIESADVQRGILELRRRSATRLQSLLEGISVALGFGQVLLVGGDEVAVTGELGALPEQRDRLLLDRMGIGEVLVELLAEFGRGEILERELDNAIEEALRAVVPSPAPGPRSGAPFRSQSDRRPAERAGRAADRRPVPCARRRRRGRRACRAYPAGPPQTRRIPYR